MGSPGNKMERKKKTKALDKGLSKGETTPESAALLTDVYAATRETVMPALQLELTEAELDEEIPQMLTASNPEAPENVTRFNAKERVFKLEAMVEQCATHYATDGWLIAKGGEEGKRQSENARLQAEAMAKLEAEETKRESATGEAADDSKQLRNQFNFSDRAAQTTLQPPKDRSCYTEPPRTTTRSGSCSQWEIYDDYVRDIETQRLQEQLIKKRSAAARKTKNQGAATTIVEDTENASSAADQGVSVRAAKILERMTVQNIFDEFCMDLKYWDDVSDTFRPNDASLLPLWEFHDAQSIGKQVTSLCPNAKHNDVFAVGYGSFESLQQTFGQISIYSIKNPTVPEKTVAIESGVLTVAFHPEFPNLLAAGCYDGSVRVLNANGNLLYTSDAAANRHSEPVWQLYWKTEAGPGILHLYSASTDGRLGQWTFSHAEIVFEPIMTIQAQTGKPNATAGLLSLDFSQLEETTYVVGTEEGAIHRCSTEYDSEYLDTYRGHELPVYGVKWNYFHPDVFLSASEDWTVRLWDTGLDRYALMKFELKAPVTDVAWAPYSSTVFAAITAAGRHKLSAALREILGLGHVFAFDVAMNRHAAVCEQKIAEKGRLTKIMFHPKQPLLLIGDTTGRIRSLKLSPNLRKIVIEGRHDAESVCRERSRLEKIMDIARKNAA